MKKYIDAQLQVVRMNNNDIVTQSLEVGGSFNVEGNVGAADRFRDDF